MSLCSYTLLKKKKIGLDLHITEDCRGCSPYRKRSYSELQTRRKASSLVAFWFFLIKKETLKPLAAAVEQLQTPTGPV